MVCKKTCNKEHLNAKHYLYVAEFFAGNNLESDEGKRMMEFRHREVTGLLWRYTCEMCCLHKFAGQASLPSLPSKPGTNEPYLQMLADKHRTHQYWQAPPAGAPAFVPAPPQKRMRFRNAIIRPASAIIIRFASAITRRCLDGECLTETQLQCTHCWSLEGCEMEVVESARRSDQ